MDSLSQMALGAAVSVAVMGRRTPLLRAALWGAACGTLPDLDALIDRGDAVRNMTLHRGETHALFYLSLAAPLIAAGIARLHRESRLFGRWWLATFLVLVTHPLLDSMTIYGTQLGLPFTNHPFGVGSIFIIDPLYTLPLLIGLGLAFGLQHQQGLHGSLRWNLWGLGLSSLYLVWGVGVQAHVRGVAEAALRDRGQDFQRLLISPTAFNSVLWRVVAMDGEDYFEGFYSLLDPAREVHFDRFARDEDLAQTLAAHDPVARLVAFSHGYYAVQAVGDTARISDLRMGQEPYYYFTFEVAQRGPQGWTPAAPKPVGSRPPSGPALRWLWQRLLARPEESGSQRLVPQQLD